MSTLPAGGARCGDWMGHGLGWAARLVAARWRGGEQLAAWRTSFLGDGLHRAARDVGDVAAAHGHDAEQPVDHLVGGCVLAEEALFLRTAARESGRRRGEQSEAVVVSSTGWRRTMDPAGTERQLPYKGAPGGRSAAIVPPGGPKQVLALRIHKQDHITSLPRPPSFVEIVFECASWSVGSLFWGVVC
jgi:hypothetical protein